MNRIITLSIFASILYFSSSVFADRQFGVDGRDGRDARDGVSGRSGQSVLVRADGAPQSLILDGSDGEDAVYSEDGEDAWSCRMGSLPAENLYGADGGNGGDGGRGGSGGNGGDVTVYYKNLADVQKIYVRSLGGRGGTGTPGARGGRPCFCQQYRWERKVCKIVKDPQGNPHEECTIYSYHCRDGSDGRSGFSGSHGFEGSMGSLTLIKSDQYLPDNVLVKRAYLSDLDGAEVELGKNIFVSKSGASRLLASGSMLSNNYSEFVERRVQTAKSKWESDRPASDFADIRVSFEFGNSGVHLTVPADIWADVSEEVKGTHTNFVVKNVLKEEEVKNVVFSVSGAETETVLVIEDHALQVDLLEDSIHMRIKRDKVFSNPEVFNGDVPADLITVEDGKITVAIGKLPVSDKDTYKKGKKIKVFTDLTRSFAGHSTTIGSLEHYEIPKK